MMWQNKPRPRKSACGWNTKINRSDSLLSGLCDCPEAEAKNEKLFGFDAGFVEQHDGDVVADRIDAAAGGALQSLLVGRRFDRRLALRANQNIEQFFRDCHSIPPAQSTVAELRGQTKSLLAHQ